MDQIRAAEAKYIDLGLDHNETVAVAGEPGSGLGLSIIKRIAEQHGADVSMDAGLACKGLRMRVRFSHVVESYAVPSSK